MTILERDRGLARRVGVLGLATTVFNTVVGAGIFVLPASLARDVGPAAPLAYVGCVLAMGAVVLCFAAASSRAPASGGPSAFAEAAFGPAAGFVVGVLIWTSAVLAAAGIASALAESLASLVPALGAPMARAGVICAVFAGLCWVNIAGVAPGARLVNVLTVLKLTPLLLLVVLAAPHLRAANLAFAPPSAHGFGRAMILALFAFQGMESALGVSGEVVDPARNVPRGLLGAMAGVALLYVAVQTAAEGLLGPALAGSHAPLADAMAAAAPALGPLMLAAAAVSMLGYLASDTLGAPRLLFAFARSGLAPRTLAALHPRTQAPSRAILLHAVLAALLAVTGSFTELALLSSLTTVVVYAAGCAAAFQLQRRGVALAGTPLVLRALPIAALVGIGCMIWIAVQATLPEALGCGAVVAVSLGWYAVARRSGRLAGIG